MSEAPVNAEGGRRIGKAPRRSSFRSRAIVYLGLGTAQRSIAMFMSPLYAHSLPQAQFGLLGLLWSLEALFMTVMDLGLSAGMLRTYFTMDRRRANAFAAYSQFQSLLVGFPVLIVIAGICAIFFALRPQPEVLVAAVFLVILSALGQRVHGIAASLYRAQEDARSYAVLSLLQIIGIPLLTVAVMIVFKLTIIGIVLVRIAIFGLTATIELYRAYRRLDPEIPKADLRATLRDSLTRYSLPMLPFNLMKWGRGQGTRALLTGAMSLTLLAVYNVASLPLQALSLTGTAFDQLFEPFYYREMQRSGTDHIRRLRGAGVLILTVQAMLCVACMPFVSDVFRLMFPHAYLSAALYAPMLLTGQFFLNFQGLYNKALINAGRVASLPAISAASTVIGAVLTFIAARYYGLAGAAIGYAVTAGLAAVFTVAMARARGRDMSMPGAESVGLVAGVVLAGALPMILSALGYGQWWQSSASALLRYPVYFAGALLVAGPSLLHYRGLVIEIAGLERFFARKSAASVTAE